MNALAYRIQVQTTKAPEFVDLTAQVVSLARDSGVRDGCVVIFSRHTTAAIKINENEPQLLRDLEAFLERAASKHGHYYHNDLSLRQAGLTEDEDSNGHAHCQHLLLGSSEVVPIVGGELCLGAWQSIFLVELDRPRPREIVVQVLGG